MTPEELKQANIEHFQRLLRSESDASKREVIERLLSEERQKGLDAYPRRVDRPSAP